MGCRLHLVGVGLSLLSNLSHHGDEAIERFLRLVLRGFNHQRLMEEQGEVDGGGMIAIVKQSLGHIHRGNTSALILQAIEDELMTTNGVDRQFIDILQRLLDVVGIERCQRTNMLNLLTTQREDIGVGTHHHAKIAVIGRHLREERLQTFAHAHRTSTRTTTAMRRRERLVQVDVHHVEPHIARTTRTQHGIQVSPVVIHQATTVVDEFRNLWDMCLEETEGVRIGHHHSGDVGAF